jgi:EAL domain-containing protein (putative c-di-GMP-specific phosphodiesterase class I)
VKIDQAFIADADRSSDCRLIIKTITDLAHGLGLIATAEGVETLEQLHLVQEIGCDFVQGYLISPPMEPRALKGWLGKFRARWPAMLAREELALWRDFEVNSLR